MEAARLPSPYMHLKPKSSPEVPSEQARALSLIAHLVTRQLGIHVQSIQESLRASWSQPGTHADPRAVATRLPGLHGPPDLSGHNEPLAACACASQHENIRRSEARVQCHGAAPSARLWPSSPLRTCTSSLPCTSTWPDAPAWLPHRPARLPHEALQRSIALLDPLCYKTVPKLHKAAWSLFQWPARTSPWVLSKRNMPLRLARGPTKILPSSHLHACVAPCRCKTLLKLQKPSWSSACSVQARPWLSKHHPPLRLATGPSRIFPSHLRTCTSNVPYTSLQGSHLAQGSRLLYGLPRWMLPYHATLRLASVDVLSLEPLHHKTLPKPQNAERSLWLPLKLHMPLRPARLHQQPLLTGEADAASVQVRGCGSLQRSHVARGAQLSCLPPSLALLYKPTLERAFVDTPMLAPPRLQKPSCTFAVWTARIAPWVLSKHNVPLLLARGRRKILLFSSTFLQHSHLEQGTQLSCGPSGLMLLHDETLQRSLAFSEPLHYKTVPKLQKPSWSFAVRHAQRTPWVISRDNMSLRLARGSKLLPSSHLHACGSSRCFSFTFLQTPNVVGGSLDLLHHASFVVRPAQTSPWVLSKPSMQLRLGRQASKTLPSLRMHASSLLYASLGASHAVRGSLLSRRPPGSATLYEPSLERASVDTPMLAVSKLQKPSWSFAVCPGQQSPWLSSKHNKPLPLAKGPIKMLVSSHLHACTSSICYTSLRPCYVARGSRLSQWPPRLKLPHERSLECASVHTPMLALLHLETMAKLQKPEQRSLWLSWRFSMLLPLASWRSKFVPFAHLQAGASSLSSLHPSHVARWSPLLDRPACSMMLYKPALERASADTLMLASAVWSAQTSPWVLSKPSMQLRLGRQASKMLPSLQMHASSPSYASLQASHAVRGSLLSCRPPGSMASLERAPVDTPMLVQKPSWSFAMCSGQQSPWLSSKHKPLQLAKGLRKILQPLFGPAFASRVSFLSRWSFRLVRGSALVTENFALLDAPHQKKLPKLQKPVRSLGVWPAMSRLARRPSKLFSCSHLHACTSSISFTSLKPSQVVQGFLVLHRSPRFLLRLRHPSVLLQLLRHKALPKLQKLWCSCGVGPALTSPWLSFKLKMPLRIARLPGKTVPSSHLDTCLDPLRQKTLPKVQKPSWLGMWPAQTLRWLLSRLKMPLRLARGPSKVLPSSPLHTCTRGLSCTPRPSHVVPGSLLLCWPSRFMLPKEESMQRALALLDPLCSKTLRHLQRPSWQTAPWVLSTRSMPLQLAPGPRKMLASSDVHACTRGSLLSHRPARLKLLHQKTLIVLSDLSISPPGDPTTGAETAFVVCSVACADLALGVSQLEAQHAAASQRAKQDRAIFTPLYLLGSTAEAFSAFCCVSWAAIALGVIQAQKARRGWPEGRERWWYLLTCMLAPAASVTLP